MPYIEEDAFSPAFSDRARTEGRALFEEGKVQWLEGNEEDFFEARLPFFRRFQTAWIERRPDGSVEFECTCPELENEGTVCAHVFAVMLAANQQQIEDGHGEDGPPPIRPTFALDLGDKALRLRLVWHGDDPDDTKPRILPADGDHLSRVEDADAQRALKALQPFAGGKRSLVDGGGFVDAQPWKLQARGRATLLRALVDAVGLVWIARAGIEPKPVSLDLDSEYDFVLGFTDGADGRLRLRGELHGPDEILALDGSIAVVADGEALARIDDRLVRVEPHGAATWLRLFAGAPDFPVGRDEVAATLDKLGAQGALPRVRLPDATEPLPLDRSAPVPAIRIERRRRDLVAQVAFRYGSRTIPVESSEGLFLDLERGVQRLRDREAEADHIEHLKEAEGLFDHEEGLPGFFEVDPGMVESLCATLLEEGCELSLDRRALRRPSNTRLEITSSGTDWFQLEGGLTFEDGSEIPLERVLEAARGGERFLDLGNGNEGLIPSSLVERLERLRSLTSNDGGNGLRFSRAQGLLIEPFLAEELDAPSLEALRGQREKLIGLGQEGPAERPAPTAFTGELRGYQARGLAWLRGLAEARLGGVLADDMGLGKTVQVIAFLLSLDEEPIEGLKGGRPTLIVAPRSLIWNWESELARFAPGLAVTTHLGPRRARDTDALGKAEIVLTSYGTLQRDVSWVKDLPMRALVLDEAQAIKNPDAKSTKAVRELEAGFRLSMTGTPVENKALDLWSQMEFLNRGLLGSAKRFTGLVGGRDRGPKTFITRAIAPLILRRKKEEVAPELPERIEQTLPVGLSDAQAKLYGSLRETARARMAGGGFEGNRMHVLETLLRLRQTACHPGLVDPELASGPSAKIDLLLDELGSIVESGQKALVFSQFTKLLDLVAPRLDAAGISWLSLTGKTRDRGAVVERFQTDPAVSTMLISLKAGGVGLNLTEADYVFILDPWWNPAAEAQAIDRAHRIGRTKKVVALRLVATGTVEERILELQQKKRELADALIAGEDGPLSQLTPEDLELLLAG